MNPPFYYPVLRIILNIFGLSQSFSVYFKYANNTSSFKNATYIPKKQSLLLSTAVIPDLRVLIQIHG